MYTRPPATTGVECVSLPSAADHLMFLPVAGSNESGRFLSSETMLRDQACPHCGWSPAKAAAAESSNRRRAVDRMAAQGSRPALPNARDDLRQFDKILQYLQPDGLAFLGMELR